MLQEFLEVRVNSNGGNTDSPTCNDIDRRSEVSNKTPRKARMYGGNENQTASMSGRQDETGAAFLM